MESEGTCNFGDAGLSFVERNIDHQFAAYVLEFGYDPANDGFDLKSRLHPRYSLDVGGGMRIGYGEKVWGDFIGLSVSIWHSSHWRHARMKKK
jgi:hypothetical protein